MPGRVRGASPMKIAVDTAVKPVTFVGQDHLTEVRSFRDVHQFAHMLDLDADLVA